MAHTLNALVKSRRTLGIVRGTVAALKKDGTIMVKSAGENDSFVTCELLCTKDGEHLMLEVCAWSLPPTASGPVS